MILIRYMKRKRFIKLLMGIGINRNTAQLFALHKPPEYSYNKFFVVICEELIRASQSDGVATISLTVCKPMEDFSMTGEFEEAQHE